MDYSELENINENLDDDWIRNFDKIDELYKDFYKDNVYFVDLKVVYINRSNEIEKIKQAPFLMTKPNCITREEILEILIDKLPPPPNGIISRWKWSLGERKKLFEYLHEIGLDITESPVSLYS